MSNKQAKELTFKEVYRCFRKANKGLKYDVDLEIWIGEKMYKVVRVGQFGIIRHVTLTLTDEPVLDLSTSTNPEPPQLEEL